jgi:hypothetical protein
MVAAPGGYRTGSWSWTRVVRKGRSLKEGTPPKRPDHFFSQVFPPSVVLHDSILPVTSTTRADP